MTFADAQRAIYVDFESTGLEADNPALLGVLRPDHVVTQFVVDPALQDAARAHHGCKAARLPQILSQLADECAAGRRIISWSRFDLKVIEAAAANASDAEVLAAEHVNALDVVPKWARTYGFRADKQKFGTRNQLHKFFPIAGYRPDWRYTRAAPARWIRRVRAQVSARGGRYDPVSKTAKRDWHQLLTYNRHDLLGLRHLVLRATAETEKRRAYLNATYAVFNGKQTITFKIGGSKPALDRLLSIHRATAWAHITACNPGLITLSPPENDRANRQLRDTIRERGYAALPGNGHDDDGRWPAEPTWFVLGMEEAEARQLAREHRQWAIVAGRVGQRARLVWCLDPGADLLVTSQLLAASDPASG